MMQNIISLRTEAIRRLLFLIVAIINVVGSSAVLRAEEKPAVTPELRGRAVAQLREALDDQEEWVKVHAAEFLLALDYPQGVTEEFTTELGEHDGKPEYRIGVWRVLARASSTDHQRNKWIGKIRDVFLDADAPDRLQALESLAKLRYKIPAKERAAFEKAAQSEDVAMRAYATWALAQCDIAGAKEQLLDFLQAEDPASRRIAANSLCDFVDLPPEARDRLVAALEKEPRDSYVRDFARGDLLAAVVIHTFPQCDESHWEELVQYATSGSTSQRLQACTALAKVASPDDLPHLLALLDHEDPDVRLAAANATLRIGRRVSRGLLPLDWAVIGLYAISMLAIGWYYARRTSSTEDYLLGGRTMKSMSLGLSLFATMLSAISYLAIPGEMIKYGPIFAIGKIASYPLIALIVGWFIIPQIMKFKVISAYEILEMRLGVSVRVLGSTMFLVLRLSWMAVVIYATSAKVLVPLLGLEQSATPWFCALLGAITVAYTSMGGLRAVVLTDVIQTFILFGGALLTLALISYNLGGLGAWWPAEWPIHWPQPRWGYDPDPDVRTFVAAFLAMMFWFVCTQGSDQMAVQRFLASRDVKAARKTLIWALVTSAAATAILTIVGLAVLAYFRANPHQMTDGQMILADADKLFPRYIAFGLPPGFSGLVMAGLLAAAMSSLSSGVNSSCSVVTIDFIDRFRKSKDSETHHVKLAMCVSVAVGIVVVLLSMLVGMVEGNLMAVGFKVCNLLTAPLFGLMFMAIFVRWATVPGTLIGAACGVAVVVAVNFWQEITGSPGISFLWAMPLGLVAQIAVGATLSLFPWGRKPLQLTE